MKLIYRVIFTSIHTSAEERDKAYDALKAAIAATVSKSALFDRADMTKDEYTTNDPTVSEKVI